MKTVRTAALEVGTLGMDNFLQCIPDHRRVRSLGLLLFLLLTTTILSKVCQGQSPLPPGPLDIHPLPGETATVRAGGPDGFFVSREALRCDRPEEAIVGFRIRRGTVLDYLQIVCARIECVNGKCEWSSYLSTRSVGDPNGGQFPALLLCRRDEALSGYRARVMRLVKLDYVEDIAIECAKIAGPPGARNVVPVLPQGRNWHTATGHLRAATIRRRLSIYGSNGGGRVRGTLAAHWWHSGAGHGSALRSRARALPGRHALGFQRRSRPGRLQAMRHPAWIDESSDGKDRSGSGQSSSASL